MMELWWNCLELFFRNVSYDFQTIPDEFQIPAHLLVRSLPQACSGQLRPGFGPLAPKPALGSAARKRSGRRPNEMEAGVWRETLHP